MILPDRDKLAPPPPYPASIAPSRSDAAVTLSTLPPHILLHIVEVTFPPSSRLEPALRRRTLYWLTTDLRLVCRRLYIACMHILRSTYISQYSSLVKYPYTSDPWPTELPGASSAIQSLQRETEVLDMFIALKAREDVYLDESDLHLGREDSFNDLFMLMQPRRRTEDLLKHYGLHYGFITLSDSDDTQNIRFAKIPFSRLGISFSSRKVGLVLTTPASKIGSRRIPAKRATILECARGRDDKLETIARSLARALGRWILDYRA